MSKNGVLNGAPMIYIKHDSLTNKASLRNNIFNVLKDFFPYVMLCCKS